MWSSPSSSADESFGIATGEFKEAEKKYLIRKGLAWEDSKGDLFDVSTPGSNSSFINKSHDESLLLFEENERRARIQNASFTDGLGKSSAKPMGLIPKINVSFNASDVSYSSSQMDFEEEEEDKENMRHDSPLSFSSANNSPKLKGDDSFAAVLSEKKIDFEDNVKKVYEADQFRNEITKSICDPDEPDEEGQTSIPDPDDEVDEDLECVMVPCTQEVMDETSSTDPDYEEARDIVPCTQYASHDVHEVDYDDDSMIIIPCTQYQQEDSYQSVADISSVPCSQGSQASQGEGSSKEDLDDTITMMTKLLALADEQEAKERMAAESILDDGESHVDVVEASVNEEDVNCSKNAEAVASSAQDVPINSDDALFKTPLKHTRVQLLKNRKMCTPSPPRSYVNQLLQRGAANKTTVISGDPVKLTKPSTPANKKPFISTSTPNRTPLNNITPVRKTPGLINGKTSVSAKIDTGLKRSPGFLPIGLSPVADYIHSKPPPSMFARTLGIPKQPPLINSASSKISLSRPSNSFTRIPFPSRISQAQEQKRHSVLKSDTFFDLKSTPPKIINNVNNVKKFAATEYKGPAKVKTTDGKVDSSPKKDFVAQRHTGIRDVSGNASFIQNAEIQKRFIPIQSRLATPPSYFRK